MENVNYLAAATFIWTGFVCTISFMEAWLKFRAPGVTLAVGLSIGRLIFSALNKVEWFFALVVLLVLYLETGFYGENAYYLFLAVAILLVQTIWLLPAMDKRAQLTIEGEELAPSNLHIYYVALELVKVIMLVSFGLQLLR